MQAAKNAAAAARRDADLAASNARRAVNAAAAAERTALDKADKVRRMESDARPRPSIAKPAPAETGPARKKQPKPKPKPTVQTNESQADRLARANYKKNDVGTRSAIEVLRVRGSRVITERKGLSNTDVPVNPVRNEP